MRILEALIHASRRRIKNGRSGLEGILVAAFALAKRSAWTIFDWSNMRLDSWKNTILEAFEFLFFCLNRLFEGRDRVS